MARFPFSPIQGKTTGGAAFIAQCDTSFAMEHFVFDLPNAYFERWPTLHRLNDIYGKGTAILWMRKRFTALYVSSASKDPTLTNAINKRADAFCAEVFDRYKISELLLFFQRFEAGRYYNKYSATTFDPAKIGAAFFQKFVPERTADIERIEREKQIREDEESATKPKQQGRSYQQYCDTLRQAKAGDMDAIKRLTPPDGDIEKTKEWLKTKEVPPA